ncbi:tRNA (guanine-N(7)-)-methyltransferase [Gracilariopsis chorda]|uniref:tRNA (guanine-N(7)-)-methyltransferase n=1 Tax=Gracilariopsis chorda TaxID=448386 RepID=A0A2V3IES6_9FLOR|nr:tRNA (guanine-N(7)-)-methyltransferase [Gracilariopsis chorda]|eukprot:PXF40589.1 tRNA (guanine-N(7)-)-methyltransferase [Gracilariopsis chorda]
MDTSQLGDSGLPGGSTNDVLIGDGKQPKDAKRTPQDPETDGRVNWMISKRDFRARAHSNPLNDGLFEPPVKPSDLAINKLYVNPPSPKVDWCDIGCGYGGLLACLSTAFPDKTMLGLEIRDRVAEFCRRRVLEMRKEYPGSYGNVAFERTNAMKYLPNYFAKGSIEKLFFCYPDPHFKKKKNRQRIISTQLLAEYAFVLEEGTGIAYIVTDVPELFEWMATRFERHPLFERRSDEEHSSDPVTRYVRDKTDEAQRVDKSDRGKHDASFRRLPNP